MITLTALSSMATRQLLAELAAAYPDAALKIESVGGVDAARRVREGEVFDLVFLASDALAKLAAEGHVQGSVPIADSSVAIAVRAGGETSDVSTEAALRACVEAAASIGYSTGPSGTALLALFARWGIEPPLVQARAGVPVASLVASGEAALGFQQLSELKDQPGITVLGAMPPGTEIRTTFSGAVGSRSAQAESARAVLEFMNHSANAETKRRNGMEPPQ